MKNTSGSSSIWTSAAALSFFEGSEEFHLILTLSSPRFILLRGAFQAWITAGDEMLTSTSNWIHRSQHAWYECALRQSSVPACTLLSSCNSKGPSLSQLGGCWKLDACTIHTNYPRLLLTFPRSRIIYVTSACAVFWPVCVSAHFLPVSQDVAHFLYLWPHPKNIC